MRLLIPVAGTIVPLVLLGASVAVVLIGRLPVL